jgi:hypothetical protein
LATSPEPGRGGISAAWAIGGTDGGKDVGVPVDARFMAPEWFWKEWVTSSEPQLDHWTLNAKLTDDEERAKDVRIETGTSPRSSAFGRAFRSKIPVP